MIVVAFLWPQLLPSLVDTEYESARHRRRAEVLVSDLEWLAEALLLILLILSVLLFSLAPARDELVSCSGGAEVLPEAVVACCLS